MDLAVNESMDTLDILVKRHNGDSHRPRKVLVRLADFGGSE